MDVALSLARRGVGTTSPNPSVGCIIVQEGIVIGRGWTQPGGRPHAETMALAQAGVKSTKSTIYVTLEPCAHHGKTPPCAEALIQAGIKRCVIAIQDTDERVAGQGIKLLQDAGIGVSVGVRAEVAGEINSGFFKRISEGRPHFTLKTATSLDGKIATKAGESKWITGSQARSMGHALRARHDAILTGMGTVRADNPELTCRLPGMQDYNPIRIILDPLQNVSRETILIQTSKICPVWIITGPDVDSEYTETLESLGARVIHCEINSDGRINLIALAKMLGDEGLTRVLVEGGAEISASFLKARLIDELIWFRAPFVIGGDGLSAIAGVSLARLIDASRLKRTDILHLGEDVMERYLFKKREGEQ
ncbi:MAG: bifunctional diaminohydroxyphosphoribosylaminopyrimidine deaminase/5-amino-6-(5-phosphoribosylamino)uracil reductase RibD [Rhodospirillales bacterium]|nr:bifunctional diaminohydroxyphosphoribosylaminopyrimidine deaminase/5-amino-6-(5-phosphoribosylamino)uracil reductase RibD [Rhodospirillales bacterium]